MASPARRASAVPISETRGELASVPIVGGPPPISEEELIAAFAKFDTDGSGALDEKELADILAMPGSKEAYSRKEAAEEAHRTLEKFDTNGDGVLEFDEFVTWYKSRLADAARERGRLEAVAAKKARAMAGRMSGQRAMQLAKIGGEVGADLSELLAQGVDVDDKSDEGHSLLFVACEAGQTAFAQYLIEQGANVSVGSAEGMSPLETCRTGAEGC